MWLQGGTHAGLLVADGISNSGVSMQVVGIWFYDQGECDKVEALLQRIVATFQPPTAPPEPVPAPVPPQPGSRVISGQ